MGGWKLREAMKEKVFLVNGNNMQRWLDREHGNAKRTLLAAPMDGLPSLDRKGLVHYQAELLQE